MKKLTVAGIIITVSGVLIAGIGVAGVIAHPESIENSYEKYKEKHNITDYTKDISEEDSKKISDISLDLEDTYFSKVSIKKSSDDEIHVTASDIYGDYFSCETENGTLKISSDVPNKKINLSFETFGFSTSNKSNLTILLPKKDYDSLTIAADSEICLEDLSSDSIQLETDLGDVAFTNIESDDCNITADLGAVTLKNSKIKNSINISADLGDVEIEESEISSASINLDCGEFTSSDCEFTGNLEVIDSLGDVKLYSSKIKCDANFQLDLGRITLEIDGDKNDYSISVTEDSSSTIDGEEIHEWNYSKDSEDYQITIDSDYSSSNVTFE